MMHRLTDTVLTLTLSSSLPTRVLESIKAGKRLPEARFANLKIAAKGQQSVLSVFSKNKPPPA